MNATEFRAVLDWWMCSDPFSQDIKVTIDEWLARESVERGYTGIIDAYHRHKADESLSAPKSGESTEPVRAEADSRKGAGTGEQRLGDAALGQVSDITPDEDYFPLKRRSCECCAHWWALDKRSDVGECRRYPPVVTPPYDGSRDDFHAIAKRSLFPTLSYVMGCGEWSKRK